MRDSDQTMSATTELMMYYELGKLATCAVVERYSELNKESLVEITIKEGTKTIKAGLGAC